jgi:hypothetical protein
MASDSTHIFDNEIKDNNAPGVTIASWPIFSLIGGLTAEDPLFDEYSEAIYVHDNTFSGNGSDPVDVYKEALGLPTIQDIFWDGSLKDASATAGGVLCAKNNGAATFLNLGHIPGITDTTKRSTDLAPHDCTQPDLPKIEISSQ